jgi:dihydroorotate dehydrogenase
VQIYSAFIYQGFGLVEEIKTELSKRLEKDGLKNISQAIGVATK